jgi:hypothetical protein
MESPITPSHHMLQKELALPSSISMLIKKTPPITMPKKIHGKKLNTAHLEKKAKLTPSPMKFLTKLKIELLLLVTLLLIILTGLMSFLVYTKIMELKSYESAQTQLEYSQSMSESLQSISKSLEALTIELSEPEVEVEVQ